MRMNLNTFKYLCGVHLRNIFTSAFYGPPFRFRPIVDHFYNLFIGKCDINLSRDERLRTDFDCLVTVISLKCLPTFYLRSSCADKIFIFHFITLCKMMLLLFYGAISFWKKMFVEEWNCVE